MVSAESSGVRRMIVELVGGSGSGKTVVKQRLCEILPERYGVHTVDARGIRRRDYMWSLQALASTWRVVSLSKKLEQHSSRRWSKEKKRRIRRKLMRFSYLRFEARNAGQTSEEPIYLTDQDLIFWARRNAASPALLEHLPLPDCVIELEAGAETMANRRLQRDQRVKEKGRDGREGGPDTDALKRELQARGTRSLVFRNDEDTDLEELVDRIADELVGDSGLVRQ